MNLLQYFSIFASIFIAELGDKTQLATLLYSTNKDIKPIMVFICSSLALACSSAIAVLLGSFCSKYLSKAPLKLIAGVAFICIGAWNIFEHFKK